MEGLVLCSRKAEKPYYVKDMDINLYSIEEMAYFLYNNAYYVDSSFFSIRLAEYIEKELSLPKIALKLKYSMGQKSNFAEMAMIIIKSSMYYEEDEMKKFTKELEEIGSKNKLERMKARADMLLQSGRYGSAMKTYKDILNDRTAEKENDIFYAGVYKGMGRINARMFYFKDAVKMFEKSYTLFADDGVKDMIIYSKMFMKPDADCEKENISIKGADDTNTETQTDAEEEYYRKVRLIKTEIQNTDDYKNMERIFSYDGRRNIDDYYDGIQSILDDWKMQYRDDVN